MHDFPPLVTPTERPETRTPARFLGWMMRTQGGLVALQLLPEDMPAAEPPSGAAEPLFALVVASTESGGSR